MKQPPPRWTQQVSLSRIRRLSLQSHSLFQPPSKNSLTLCISGCTRRLVGDLQVNREKRRGKDGIHIIGADADTNMRELKDYDICS